MTRGTMSNGAIALVCTFLLASIQENEAFAGPPLFVTNNLTDDLAGGRLVEYDGSTGQWWWASPYCTCNAKHNRFACRCYNDL